MFKLSGETRGQFLLKNKDVWARAVRQDQATQRATPTSRVVLDMNRLAQLSIPTVFGKFS